MAQERLHCAKRFSSSRLFSMASKSPLQMLYFYSIHIIGKQLNILLQSCYSGVIMARPKVVSDEEFIDLWKKTKGNLMEIARMLRADDPTSLYRTLIRAKERLITQGKITTRAEIKPSEVALLIDDFDQLPEVAEWQKYMYAKNLSEKTIKGRLYTIKALWKRLNKKRPITFDVGDVLNEMARLRQERKIDVFGFVTDMRNFFKFLAYKDYLESRVVGLFSSISLPCNRQ